MSSVRTMCDQVAWLNKGELMTVGAAEATIAAYEGSIGQGS
jgi:ABC-type polysaccharide/polyol phosphate transport system ATPase subunit